ncbi:ATP-binding protein [Paraclostridium bifermentans]|uniref:ATP-binding protein n=1 Tax=Paraclostridium bifermentans TaxID=1490 RepID=UPI001A9B6E6D|nr:sensor histidine kinase [Paraclostridium bifermentans]
MLVLKSIMYKRNIFENIKLTLPVITNIVSFLLIFRSTAKYVENIILDNVVVIFTGFIIVLSNIYLLKFIDELIEKHNIKLENKFIKEKINIESKYINNLKENHKRIKILKHDMKNHLICIKNIANDKESLLRYIDNIMLEINKHEQAFNTGNIVLDSILDEKTAICKKHNINLNVDIIFNRNEFMDLIDVCSIFSNSIDNAIEACIKINEERKREIYIKGNYIKDMFILKIENVKLNKVIVKNNKILSDKNDSINHGLGIQSIKNSVKKYMGDVFIDFTSDKFTIKIIIPLKNDNLCK